MTLPSFLGIGAQRSGTSWLYQQLKNHPDIFMSERKEINFFDRNYELGIEWYENFFPELDNSPAIKVYGEISPGYLYSDDAAQRISMHLPDCKLIAILRNPVERSYSQYKYSVRNNNDQRSFLEYTQETETLPISFYSKQVERFLQYFHSQNILFLIFEEVMSNQPIALEKIGNFIGVDPSKFLYENSIKKVNSSNNFRFNNLFRIVREYFKTLRKKGLYVEPVTNFMKSIYFSLPENVLYSKANGDDDGGQLESQIYNDLFNKFEADIDRLEALIARDLAVWKTKADGF